MKTFHYIALALTALLLVTSCAIDEMWSDVEPADEQKVLTFKPKFEDFETVTKAIGDGSKVDKLLVQVYEENGETPVFSEDYSRDDWNKFQIAFYYGKTYKVYFWAYDSYAPFTAYNYTFINDEIQLNKPIKINYPQNDLAYNTLESLDAFYSVQTVNLSASDKKENTVKLTRPFAQVNLGALAEDFDDAQVSEAVFKVKDIPSVFTLSDSGVNADDNSETITSPSFTFTDFDLDDDESNITFDNKDYRYIGTTYILVPSLTDKVTVDVAIYGQDPNSPMKEATVELTVGSNKRTNLIFKEIAPSWNDSLADSSEDVPSTETEDGWIHITKPEELAALLIYGGTEGKKYHICANLDMSGMPQTTASQIGLAESGYRKLTIDAGKYNGDKVTGSYMLKNINGLKAFFGIASDLHIQNIILDNVNVSGDTHVGVLVNSLSGQNKFTNVTIQNSSAETSSGAAGGMIGYVVRSSKEDRSETLSVTIDNCKINHTTAAGTLSRGKFIGLFSGYDNGETLVFTGNSSVDSETSVHSYSSRYVEGNEGAWLAKKDYTAYNGWLGDEEYYRGKIYFGDPAAEANRFCPKWDGKTTVEPLLADPTYDGTNAVAGINKFAVYSPFDLAGVRKKTASPAAIYLKADIDMNGQGADGSYNVPSNFTKSAHSSADDIVFDPFSYVTTLDGYRDETTNNSIYNLSIAQIEQERAAFILYASGITVHKNINFRNCQTVAVHKPVETDAKAYGAILVSNVDATYTMENVHAYDCKVFALQKIGTLGARISGTSTLKNNSVNNCYVENYECFIGERFTSGKIDKTISIPFLGEAYVEEVYADFYPHGEVGGMYGFIQGKSDISDCNVNSTIIHAYGQNDDEATIVGNRLAQVGISILGYYLVPGRHVSTFIGNIRATGAISINSCKIDSASECTNRWDKHQWRVNKGSSWKPNYVYTSYDYIGQAYYVEFVDQKGSVTVDGAALTLGDCKDGTLYGTK